MTNPNYLSSILIITWQTWLFSLVVALIASGFIFLLLRKKMKTILNDNGALHQRIVECTELLNYSKESERKAKEETELSNRSKSLLLAKLSHEIRTPMNGVIGMASLLSETELTAEQREYAEVIIQSSENLMTTINDMLVTDVMNAETGNAGMELEDKDFDLRNTVEGVLDSFSNKAAQTGLELIYSMDKDVPEMMVGDEVRLRQILMNLVENALRFTTQGEILIAVRMLRILEGNQADIGFEVRDTGIGLPADEIEILSKDISDINTREDGHALSLAICKKLVSLMGGTLELETKEGGKSSTVIKFKIRLRASLQPQRSQGKFDDNLRRKNILLVDDNFTSRSIIKKQLEQWNLLPIVAASPKEALEIINKNSRFDLIITDMEMPGMNGIELAEAVKKINPKISLILLNAIGDDRSKDQPGLFRAIITKPVKQHLFHKYISHELNRSDIPAEQQNAKPKITSDLAKNYPLRILVAEDNKTNQDVALKVLNKLGYEAALAQNGEEALEMVSEEKYDLIFMDIQMPVKDGLEATRMIRLCLNTQPVIIAMTANAIQGDRQKCLNAGMDDYMSKPFKIEELTKMIEKWAMQLKVNK
jgi:CheY-like chemotaxis protein/signal transduction histidine kinase